MQMTGKAYYLTGFLVPGNKEKLLDDMPLKWVIGNSNNNNWLVQPIKMADRLNIKEGDEDWWN